MPNKTYKDLVLVMDSIAVPARGTWVTFEKLRWSESPSSGRVQMQKNEKMFSFVMLRGGPTGT
jgi:hypothetical protein